MSQPQMAGCTVAPGEKDEVHLGWGTKHSQANMPKKPPRDNPRNRASRTVQSAGSILQRIIPSTESIDFQRNPRVKSLLAKLPEGLRGHVVAALEKPGELIIFADSAAWVARLRVLIAELPAAAEAGPSPRITVRLIPAGTAIRRGISA